MWTEVKHPNLKSFIFFGSSAGDDAWGIDCAAPDRIIAYHHHMEDEFEVMGSDILDVFRSDYAIYERLDKKG